MSEPQSHLFDGRPRLHYLEWNREGRTTLVLLHGNSANAWWWQPLARVIAPRFRLFALDQRGHGDSEWMRPPAYTPADYAEDLCRFVRHVTRPGDKPIVVGHSMGGLSVLAFARRHPDEARGAVAIDIAVTSSHGRDRYLRRLRGLPTVTYPDLATARERFRLMPSEGGVARETLHEIAERSLARTEEGRFTLKFDRESFFGSDGISVLDTIRALRIATLLVRAERSRIMTAEAAERARESNPLVSLVTIRDAHHHVLLERPDEVARVIEEFVAGLDGAVS
jgi:pimeloyl-ACP methyl ester carboxylesterase